MTDSAAQATIPVFAGVDTHKDTHTYAVVDPGGLVLGKATYPTTLAGYLKALTWAASFGAVQVWGVESSGSYGLGLVRLLAGHGQVVKAVKYPATGLKGTTAKTDEHDAVSAARAVVFNHPVLVGEVKTPLPQVQALSWALTERQQHTKISKEGVILLKAMLVSAPVELRDSLRGASTTTLLRTAAGWRPGRSNDLSSVFKRRFQPMARAVLDARERIREIDVEIESLILELCPALLGIIGIGPVGAATILVAVGWNGPGSVPSEPKLAAYSGTAPIPASSGKTNRHRLSRGGNRQLNSVLHRAVLAQRRFDPDVQAWFEHKLTQPGKTKRDVIRCSKRHLVRVVRKALLNPHGMTQSGYLTS